MKHRRFLAKLFRALLDKAHGEGYRLPYGMNLAFVKTGGTDDGRVQIYDTNNYQYICVERVMFDPEFHSKLGGSPDVLARLAETPVASRIEILAGFYLTADVITKILGSKDRDHPDMREEALPVESPS